ncbi:MAG: hypothetical protein HYT07_00320 [Candidatus Levybacteria bacterium]|nr:hypothetical protein [Candidatus Levybacteria bacterium]
MQIDTIISSYSIQVTIYGSILLLILVFISLASKKLSNSLKKILFFSIVAIVISVTLFLMGSTIYLNTVSLSKGPVHYHADFEIWNCGEEIELEDPEGLENKVGTSTLHEHNDSRIHLEGVVVDNLSASLGNFFEELGGYITPNSLSIRTHNGPLTLKSNYMCQNGAIGQLQVFVYKTQNGIFYQEKIDDPANYVISPHTNVPPGDCIIIEFGEFKNKTDKLCRSFKVQEALGKIRGLKYGN